MKVYVVICVDDNNGPAFVVGVYRNVEKALAVCSENNDYYYDDVELEDE